MLENWPIRSREKVSCMRIGMLVLICCQISKCGRVLPLFGDNGMLSSNHVQEKAANK